MLKYTNGITLIALVITVIIILILAGTSIAMLTGESGIIKNAEFAKETTEISVERESIQLIMQKYEIDGDSNYDIGTKLYDRNISNGTKWSIIIMKDTKQTYGTNWRYISKETELPNYGQAKYNWVYNDETGEIVNLEEDSYIELAYGGNLAVKEGLVLNLDPLNMENSDSWGDVTLHGFNGVEKDEEGNIISGFSGTDFNFDGVDDWIEIYCDDNFGNEGITIETYGKLDENNNILGNIYKGLPDIPTGNAIKYNTGNRNCFAEPDNIYFQSAGTFYQGISVGSKYQCKYAPYDFHLKISDDIYYGDAYVTFSLKSDGSFYLMLNGEKVLEDSFNKEYVEAYTQNLNNKEYPIIIGKNALGEKEFLYYKIKTYATRLYSKALTEEEAIENYEKTKLYHEMLQN